MGIEPTFAAHSPRMPELVANKILLNPRVLTRYLSAGEVSVVGILPTLAHSPLSTLKLYPLPFMTWRAFLTDKYILYYFTTMCQGK